MTATVTAKSKEHARPAAMVRGASFGWGEARPSSRAALVSSLLVAAILLGVGALVIIDRRAIAASGPDAPADEFQAARAMVDLEAITREPHHVGQPDHPRVRNHLVEVLQEMGLETEVQAATIDGRSTVYNVLGRLPGSDSTGAVLLMAHYDSVRQSQGATDDAIGTVVMAEVGRVLANGDPLRNDLIVALVDGEESGLRGSRAFVEEHLWADDVGFVVNIDGGGRGAATVAEVHRATPEIMRIYADIAPNPNASSAMVAVADALQDADFGGSDFSELRALDVPGFFLAHTVDAAVSHTPADAIDRVSDRTVQHHGATVLALARMFGDRDLGKEAPGEAVVFPGLLTWLNPIWGVGVAWAMLLLTMLALAAFTVVAFRSGARLRGILRGVVTSLVAVLAAVVTGSMALGLQQLLRPAYRPHFRGLTPDNDVRGLGLAQAELLYWGFLLLTVAAVVVLLGRARRRASATEIFLGAMMVTSLLALLSTNGLVGASYLFTLPAIFLLGAALFWLRVLGGETGTLRSAAVLGLGAVPTVLVATGLFWQLQVLTQANIGLLAPLAALLSMPLVLQFEAIAAHDVRTPLATIGGTAMALVLLGQVMVPAEPLMVQATWQGAPSETRTLTRMPELAVGGVSLHRVDTAAGRTCLRASPDVSPDANGAITFCPLPHDVAPVVDVQFLEGNGQIVLIGNVADEIEALTVFAGGTEISAELVALDGTTTRFFRLALPRGSRHVDRLIATASDGTIHQRDGFALVPVGSEDPH